MNIAPVPLDLLSIGTTAYDLVFSIPADPVPDAKTQAEGFFSAGGGPALNGAVLAARHGLQAGFCGYLDNQHFGEKHYRELADEGIRLDWVVRGDSPSPMAVILVKPDGRRFLVNYSGMTPHLPAGSVDFSTVSPRAVLFDGHEPYLSRQLMDYIKGSGVISVLDAGSVHRGTLDLLADVDHCVCSQKFARQFSGQGSPQAALEALCRHTASVVITLGEDGLVWRNSGGSGSLPAFDIQAVDTTGAGDTFHGAFTVCLLEGKSWQETLLYASAAAACSCLKLGARPGIPTRQEVDDFLQNHTLKAA